VNPIRLLEDLDFLEHVALDLVEPWACHVCELPAWTPRPEACPDLFVVSEDKLSLFDEDLPPLKAGLLQGGLYGGRGIKARGLPVRMRLGAWWMDVGT
jgi:hypothetical protein